MVRRLVVAIVALGLLCGVTAAGCAPATSRPVRVLVIGDSLTVGAAQAGMGDAAWTIDGVVGRGTNTGVAVARTWDIADFDVVVVALGTNDYLDTKATYGGRITAMMAVLGRKVPVIWVDVDTHEAKLGSAATGVNPAIDAAPARFANLTVGRWDQYTASLSGFAAQRSSDGIHYTPRGFAIRAAWTERIVAAVRR